MARVAARGIDRLQRIPVMARVTARGIVRLTVGVGTLICNCLTLIAGVVGCQCAAP